MRAVGRFFALVSSVLVGVAVIGACSTGSGGGTGATGSAACEQACAKCGADPCLDCAEASERYRDEFENVLFSCVANSDACSDSIWESCAAQAAAGLAPRSDDESYHDACFAKRSECEAQSAGFADDYCLSTQVFTTAWLAQAEQCLTKACVEVPTCVREL